MDPPSVRQNQGDDVRLIAAFLADQAESNPFRSAEMPVATPGFTQVCDIAMVYDVGRVFGERLRLLPGVEPGSRSAIRPETVFNHSMAPAEATAAIQPSLIWRVGVIFRLRVVATTSVSHANSGAVETRRRSFAGLQNILLRSVPLVAGKIAPGRSHTSRIAP